MKIIVNDQGNYLDEEGIEYEDLCEFLQIGFLKFCGCGNREKNLDLIYQLLTLNKNYHDELESELYLSKRFLYNSYQDKLKKFVQNNGELLLDFFWYVMNEKKITEHGYSLPGWLHNEDFYNYLKQWYELYNSRELKE